MRVIYDAQDSKIDSASPGQLVRLTGVSKDSLKFVKQANGGKHGGTSIGGSENAILPVGKYLFALRDRKEMSSIVQANRLDMNYLASAFDVEDDDCEQDDYDLALDTDADREKFDDGTEQNLMELISDSSIFIKTDTAGSLRNAAQSIDDSWGIHLAGGRIGTYITTADLWVCILK